MDTKNMLSSLVDKYVKPAIDQYKSSDWGSKWSQQPASGSNNQPSTPDNTDSTGSSENSPWQGDWQSALSDFLKKGRGGSDSTDTGNTGTDNTGSDNTGSDNTGSGSTGGSASSGAPPPIHGRRKQVHCPLPGDLGAMPKH